MYSSPQHVLLLAKSSIRVKCIGMQDSPSNRFRENGEAASSAVPAAQPAPARRAERGGIQVINRAAAILRALRNLSLIHI